MCGLRDIFASGASAVAVEHTGWLNRNSSRGHGFKPGECFIFGEVDSHT